MEAGKPLHDGGQNCAPGERPKREVRPAQAPPRPRINEPLPAPSVPRAPGRAGNARLAANHVLSPVHGCRRVLGGSKSFVDGQRGFDVGGVGYTRMKSQFREIIGKGIALHKK
jgi:hypothetical protein